MPLPEAVKVYFLLNAANISEEYEKLARTTHGVLCQTAHMKNTVIKVSDDPCRRERKQCGSFTNKRRMFPVEIGASQIIERKRKKESIGKGRQKGFKRQL